LRRTTAWGRIRAAAFDREERNREVYVNQRLSQSLIPRPSRPAARHSLRLRVVALIASAAAAGALAIVVSDGISGGDGVGGTGNTITATGAVPAANGVISSDGISGGGLVTSADNGVIMAD
jgi:hypothetical protein